MICHVMPKYTVRLDEAVVHTIRIPVAESQNF